MTKVNFQQFVEGCRVLASSKEKKQEKKMREISMYLPQLIVSSEHVEAVFEQHHGDDGMLNYIEFLDALVTLVSCAFEVMS